MPTAPVAPTTAIWGSRLINGYDNTWLGGGCQMGGGTVKNASENRNSNFEIRSCLGKFQAESKAQRECFLLGTRRRNEKSAHNVCVYPVRRSGRRRAWSVCNVLPGKALCGSFAE